MNRDRLREKFEIKLFWKIILCIGLVICLSSVLRTFDSYPNFSISISAIIATIMCFLALTDNGYFYVNVPLLSSIIDWLASRLYSIFCCHIFCWFLVKEIYIFLGLNEGIGSFLIGLIFMVVASEFSYKYIENFINKGR